MALEPSLLLARKNAEGTGLKGEQRREWGCRAQTACLKRLALKEKREQSW